MTLENIIISPLMSSARPIPSHNINGAPKAEPTINAPKPQSLLAEM